MIFPERRLAELPPIRLPDGYAMRQYEARDAAAYVHLLQSAGFEFAAEHLPIWLERVLPDGLFLVEHQRSGELAASAIAAHHPLELHPFGGELGWVAAAPDHRGRGLGLAVCTAVLRRFAHAGYHRVYLRTDDFRLPALRIYLKLGFLPFLYADGIEERWQTICARLKWPFTPQEWPRVP